MMTLGFVDTLSVILIVTIATVVFYCLCFVGLFSPTNLMHSNWCFFEKVRGHEEKGDYGL